MGGRVGWAGKRRKGREVGERRSGEDVMTHQVIICSVEFN